MLYFVATPIGNLKDISLRALEVLKSVDIIACEDTRTSLKLLNHYDINKKLIAYHKFNEKDSADGILALLCQGKDVAIITDAGTPLISDPGQTLAFLLRQHNIEYTVIPGANAVLSALVLSSFSTQRFSFVGFLPEKMKDKNNILREVLPLKQTLVFYVSPHGLEKEIAAIASILGNRKAALVSEITKMHEKVIYFTLGEPFQISPKGEYVLVVEGKADDIEEKMTIQEHVKFYLNLGYLKNDAIKLVAKDRNVAKSVIYSEINKK